MDLLRLYWGEARYPFIARHHNIPIFEAVQIGQRHIVTDQYRREYYRSNLLSIKANNVRANLVPEGVKSLETNYLHGNAEELPFSIKKLCVWHFVEVGHPDLSRHKLVEYSGAYTVLPPTLKKFRMISGPLHPIQFPPRLVDLHVGLGSTLNFDSIAHLPLRRIKIMFLDNIDSRIESMPLHTLRICIHSTTHRSPIILPSSVTVLHVPCPDDFQTDHLNLRSANFIPSKIPEKLRICESSVDDLANHEVGSLKSLLVIPYQDTITRHDFSRYINLRHLDWRSCKAINLPPSLTSVSVFGLSASRMYPVLQHLQAREMIPSSILKHMPYLTTIDLPTDDVLVAASLRHVRKADLASTWPLTLRQKQQLSEIAERRDSRYFLSVMDGIRLTVFDRQTRSKYLMRNPNLSLWALYVISIAAAATCVYFIY